MQKHKKNSDPLEQGIGDQQITTNNSDENDSIQISEDSQQQSTEKLSQLIYMVRQKVESYKAENSNKEQMVPYSKILLTFADRQEKTFIVLGYLTAIATGFGLPSFIFLLGDVINSFGPGTDDVVTALRPICIKLLVIGIAIWITTYLYYTLLVIMSERIGKKTRVAYLQAVLQQEIAWFDQNNVAELPAKIARDSDLIKKAIGEKMGQILFALSMCFSGLLFAFFRGWWMSLILLLVLPLMMICTMLIGSAIGTGFNQSLKSYCQSAGYAEQALNAIKVVQAFGQEATEMTNYERYLKRAKITGFKVHIKTAFAIGFFHFIMFGYYAYAFYTGSYLITKQVINTRTGTNYTAGDILTCLFGVIFDIVQLGMCIPNIKAVTEGRIAGKSAFDIIDRKPKILLEDKSYLPGEEISGHIEFKNVTFRYPTRPEQKILDGFSAVFEEGKTTAIVGASGSGKSTIIQLIERFYDPEAGDIFLNGKKLIEINLRELRRKIGYVGQEPVLFNTSIKNNLLYGNPSATDEQLISALKSANAWDFISQNLEKRIYTNAGNFGDQLSGGQKQRIAIARAFIKQPKILLLDEATSALDKKNEQEVQGAIDQIRKDLGSVTTIVIAHRLSTIRNADNIICLSKGKIVEQGNHEELLKNFPKGIYSKFVNEQQMPENVTYQEMSPAHLNKAQNEKYDKPLSQELKNLEEQIKEKVNAVDDVKEKELCRLNEQIKTQSHLGRLFKITIPKWLLFLSIALSIILGSEMPAFGIFIGKMLFVLQPEYPATELQMDKVREESNILCLGMFILSAWAFLLAGGQIFSFGILGENLTQLIRTDLYKSIITKHIGWFDHPDNSPSVISAVMASDAQTINGVVIASLATSCQCLFAVIAIIFIGFAFNWKMGLVYMGCFPLIMIGGVMKAKFQKVISQDSDEAMKNANMLAGDSIINYKTVASFANQNQIIRDFSDLLEGPVRVATKKCHAIGICYGYTHFTYYGVFNLMFYCGGLFLKQFIEDNNHNQANADEFLEYSKSIFIGIFAIMFGAMAVGQSQQFGPDLGKAMASAAIIFRLMDIKSEINAIDPENPDQKKIVNPETFKGEIEFQNVWFRYPTRRNDWVLKGLNLHIKPNETVAIVGESGCGKSTTVQLLLRFYDVNEGRILIDGADIRDYDLNSLRKAMGLVMQEPTLFNYSIIDNVLYGSSNATNSEVREATSISNANEFIESRELENAIDEQPENLYQELLRNREKFIEQTSEKEYEKVLKLIDGLRKEEEKKGQFSAIEGVIDKRTPDKKDIELHQGFNIQCGFRGCKLSGGQKQRVAIARAIIRKPQVLILDEATSALDEESQKKVQVALNNIMKDRTSIVIAHRLTTIEQCDRILVLESGRLVEEGYFSDLKDKDGGFFAQLASGMQQNAIQ